jgi:hypothetical protein
VEKSNQRIATSVIFKFKFPNEYNRTIHMYLGKLNVDQSGHPVSSPPDTLAKIPNEFSTVKTILLIKLVKKK